MAEKLQIYKCMVCGNIVEALHGGAGDAPEAVFNIEADTVAAREHCNIHGLWKGQ